MSKALQQVLKLNQAPDSDQVWNGGGPDPSVAGTKSSLSLGRTEWLRGDIKPRGSLESRGGSRQAYLLEFMDTIVRVRTWYAMRAE